MVNDGGLSTTFLSDEDDQILFVGVFNVVTVLEVVVEPVHLVLPLLRFLCCALHC